MRPPIILAKNSDGSYTLSCGKAFLGNYANKAEGQKAFRETIGRFSR